MTVGLGMGRCVELEGRFTCGQMALLEACESCETKRVLFAASVQSQRERRRVVGGSISIQQAARLTLDCLPPSGGACGSLSS